MLEQLPEQEGRVKEDPESTSLRDGPRQGRSSVPRGTGGFALLVVIVVMLLTSFLASQLIFQVRTELKIAYNSKKRAKERFLAEAGINLGLFRLVDRAVDYDEDEQYGVMKQGYVYEETSLSTGKISYYGVSETGKIDLNTSPRQLFELICEYHKLETDQIAIIVDSLYDWRDSDDLHRLNGAEGEHYSSLEEPYVPRNGNIQDPAEFFLINGAELLLGRFQADEVFTVHNSKGRYKGKININSLTPAILDFLVEGEEEKKASYYELLEEMKGHIQLGMLREILGNERYEIVRPYLADRTDAHQSMVYYIVSTGFAAEEEGFEREEPMPGTRITAVIEYQNKKHTFLSWKESRS